MDNSFSMRASGHGGAASDRARDELARILEHLPTGSEAGVILAGHPPRALSDRPATILDQIPKALQIEPSLAGPLALGDALQLADTLLKRSANSAREVLLVSDFQQSDWRSIATGAPIPQLDRLRKENAAPQFTFYRVAGDILDNLSVASVDSSAFVVARDQTVALRARLRNHGARPAQDVAVHLEADGARLRSTRISIAPNAETVLALNHTFDTAGDHALTVRIEGDSFPEDNAWSLVVPVREQVNCLLAGRDSRAAPLDGATDFVEIALAPHHSAAAKSLRDVIHTTLADHRRLNEKSLAGVEVAILADIDKIAGRLVSDLETFVRRGGGLVLFAGPSTDTRAWVQDLWKKGQGLLPCEIKGAGHVDEGEAPARILNQRHTHPATVYFNDARGVRLQDAAFQHWLKFDRVEGDARVLLSLDRGDPLVVERPFGKGRVIAVATTANARWNNLPLQPVFVPLMQRLVTYLAAQSAAPQSQLTGAPLRAPLRPDQAGESFVVIDPMNQSHDLAPLRDRDGGAFVEFARTSLPGVYELRPKLAPKADPPRRFAFHLNPAESSLAPLAPAQVRDVAARLGAGFAESYHDYEALDRARRHGSEIWQPLLLALLGLMFTEVWLQQRISRP